MWTKLLKTNTSLWGQCLFTYQLHRWWRVQSCSRCLTSCSLWPWQRTHTSCWAWGLLLCSWEMLCLLTIQIRNKQKNEKESVVNSANEIMWNNYQINQTKVHSVQNNRRTRPTSVLTSLHWLVIHLRLTDTLMPCFLQRGSQLVSSLSLPISTGRRQILSSTPSQDTS